MKKLYMSIVALMLLLSAGCHSPNTGVVFVDRNLAKDNGIIITSFTDNPFYAYIEYDYSAIKDFDESKVDVTLVNTLLPYAMWQQCDGMATMFYAQMDISMLDNMLPSTSWGSRKADISERRPGYLKIFALDDIGIYQITYKGAKK